ncbi:hypothetical protein GT347_24500 [Xylophilus rhododendri]|uniref:Uncharacterized protein n=1 Tax=Xylophilus rhododendri TaxID=2697032 RepID=A0A857JAY8_9BURK|nr:hypothetical protein [Xylophilus rhododendri]QHJ00868.1 hypothetical protein GT347_24500 [Xylophilus rhododendri]
MVSNYATKSDVANISVALHKELNQQTWILVKELNAQTWKLIGWTTGLGASMVGFTFWLARAIH